jgi:hypothetical protein
VKKTYNLKQPALAKNGTCVEFETLEPLPPPMTLVVQVSKTIKGHELQRGSKSN